MGHLFLRKHKMRKRHLPTFDEMLKCIDNEFGHQEYTGDARKAMYWFIVNFRDRFYYSWRDLKHTLRCINAKIHPTDKSIKDESEESEKFWRVLDWEFR